jgi:Na+-translocating ferredoxin:NAD+ oxidoreductase subunit C
LIELLTGEEVPSGLFPNAIGYVCQNVGTAYALHRLATRNEPLTSRIVTVTGSGVVTPQNLEVPIGTPIRFLIECCGGYTDNVSRLIHGGSMMGYALPDDELPITKATSCIIAAAYAEVRQDFREWPCIRCGDCATVCPARLLPQEILAATQIDDHRALDALGLDDCIECGCCDVACPSHIVLTDRFRAAKHSHFKHERQLELSAASEQRHRLREHRLESGERRSQEAQEALLRDVHSDDEAARKQAIAAAVARAKRRRDHETSE